MTMLGPHSTVNGTVHIDGVTVKSCTYAVTMGLGGVKKEKWERNPNATNKRFSDGISVKNIRVIFGENAQIKTHAMLEIPEKYDDDLRPRPVPKFFDKPSIGALKDSTNGTYKVIIESITFEGFKYNTDKKILTPDDFRQKNGRKNCANRGISGS